MKPSPSDFSENTFFLALTFEGSQCFFDIIAVNFYLHISPRFFLPPNPSLSSLGHDLIPIRI